MSLPSGPIRPLRKDLQLVIRVHPAEVTGSPASRQRAIDEIAAEFPQLPDNVVVVSPESPASSYGLVKVANGVLNLWGPE